MFVQISSDSLNLLLPNLVWWYITVSQIVFHKDWFAVFKAKVTVTHNIIKTCLFEYIIWTADPATELGLMVHHHKVDCLVKRLDCSVVVKVKVTFISAFSNEKQVLFCSQKLWHTILVWCWLKYDDVLTEMITCPNLTKLYILLVHHKKSG